MTIVTDFGTAARYSLQPLDGFQGPRGVIFRLIQVFQDLPDDPLLVDDERRSAIAEALLAEDAKGFRPSEGWEVSDQGIRQTAVVRECLLRRRRIGAAAQNLGIELLELRDQALEAPQLSLSAAGEGPGIERENEGLAPLEAGDRNIFPVMGGKSDVGRLRAGSQGHGGPPGWS